MLNGDGKRSRDGRGDDDDREAKKEKVDDDDDDGEEMEIDDEEESGATKGNNSGQCTRCYTSPTGPVSLT